MPLTHPQSSAAAAVPRPGLMDVVHTGYAKLRAVSAVVAVVGWGTFLWLYMAASPPEVRPVTQATFAISHC